MDHGLTELIAASVAFVGSHFAMSHPLRGPMVQVLGERGFQAAYSLISLAAFAWMYLAFGRAPASTPLWAGYDDVSWAIASVLTLAAMVLLAGSLMARNPALPMPGAQNAARSEPTGALKVTRHPMMWGFALWAVAHLIAAPTARTMVVALAILVLALVGSHMQDRKKRGQMGAAWSLWVSRTSFWPRWVRLPSIGIGPWLVGIALWLAFSWLHVPLGGIPAGIWRWLG